MHPAHMQPMPHGPSTSNFAKAQLAAQKPPRHKDMYSKILAYDTPPGEGAMTNSLSTNCLNHTAEEVSG